VATPKQIAANRRNAARSSGPRTEQGKARSKKNAFRHGLSAVQSHTNVTWEQIPSPSLEQVQGRLLEIERQRLTLLREIDSLLPAGSTKDVSQHLQRLEALDRYIKRAHSRMRKLES
jgi:hypothetical protein